MPTLTELNDFLRHYFSAEHFGSDQNGIYRASDEALERPVRRIGLMLEPFPKLADWTKKNKLDALFIHRPWKLDKITPPAEDVGILAYHYAFDERLTTGYNPRLADALLMEDINVLVYKEGRPLGMIGDVPKQAPEDLRAQVEEVFGGLEGSYLQGDLEEVSRICVVGAMRGPLIYEARERGAALYLTGQYRDHARSAVDDTDMNVLEIGHARCERWGLRALMGVLCERFVGLRVVAKS